jgi:hypothetical protein
MSNKWQYQIRIHLGEELAALARSNPSSPAIKPLTDILSKHRATMKCQYDAFAEYVAEAEQNGIQDYPLYKWTKATIENSEKKQKYLKNFALYIDGNAVYGKDAAEALEADLQPCVGELIRQISKHDTNPAHNPQPPVRFR